MAFMFNDAESQNRFPCSGALIWLRECPFEGLRSMF